MNKLSIAGFTNLGYLLHSRDFDPITADLTGQTVVVTGATGGIGLETASTLSALNARVIAIGRSQDKLDSLGSHLREPYRAMRADLSLMSEVRRIAEDLNGSESVDVLVNNVGVLLPEYEETDEGLEKSFATDVAGHFLLTNLLLPGMVSVGSGRIVNISSGGMYSARANPKKLPMSEDRYNGTEAYAQAKRAQVILTEMWNGKLEGTGVSVNAMHPGWVETAGVAFSLPTFNKVMKPFLRSVAQGADTIVWLAAGQTDQSGKFWFDRRPVETHLSSSTKASAETRQVIWKKLAEVTQSDLTL